MYVLDCNRVVTSFYHVVCNWVHIVLGCFLVWPFVTYWQYHWEFDCNQISLIRRIRHPHLVTSYRNSNAVQHYRKHQSVWHKVLEKLRKEGRSIESPWFTVKHCWQMIRTEKTTFVVSAFSPLFLMPNYSLELDFMPIWGLEYKYMLTN